MTWGEENRILNLENKVEQLSQKVNLLHSAIVELSEAKGPCRKRRKREKPDITATFDSKNQKSVAVLEYILSQNTLDVKLLSSTFDISNETVRAIMTTVFNQWNVLSLTSVNEFSWSYHYSSTKIPSPITDKKALDALLVKLGAEEDLKKHFGSAFEF
jgi:hypothetical protein